MISKRWIPKLYQLKALCFLLLNNRCGLFLDPGLGKTSISLSAIKILKFSSKRKGVLLIAPLRVVYSVWPQEIKKWRNFNNLTYTILHEENKVSLWENEKDIYLINPEGLEWLHGELLKGLTEGKKCPFDILWIDESTKFKNFKSKRLQFLVDMLPLFKRRHIMTGTPAPKGLINLWSQLFILDEGKCLGPNFYEYRKKYFETNDWDKHTWNIKDFSADIIHKKVAPLVLEMSAEDYLDMPPIVYNTISITLPSKAMKYYKKMEKEYFIELDGMEASADQAAQAGQKCHQIANGQVYEDIPDNLTDDEIREFKKTRKVIHIHSAKLDALQDLLDELNGKPLLIAYHYKHDLQALQLLLGKDLPYIGSGTTIDAALTLEEQWNNGKLAYLAGQPGSMAHGLNFQYGGRDVLWYSLTWDLEMYIQFNKRLDRPGANEETRIHHLISENTVDEAMLYRLGERAEEQINLRKAINLYRKGNII